MGTMRFWSSVVVLLLAACGATGGPAPVSTDGGALPSMPDMPGWPGCNPSLRCHEPGMGRPRIVNACSDNENCRVCGNVCGRNAPNGVFGCYLGACFVNCPQNGPFNCDGNVDNGCESPQPCPPPPDLAPSPDAGGNSGG